PTITVDKTGPTTIPEGTTATYGFTITNTSSASTDPVTITSVIDTTLGDLTSTANAAWIAQGHSTPIVLAQGESFTFSFTTGVLGPGTGTNTVTVTGHDDEDTPASTQDSHTLVVSNLAPVITVAKTAAVNAFPEGNTATYNFAITNASPAVTEIVTITSVVDDV